MGRKKKTPKFPPLSLETSKSNIKLQPTISQSFNRVGEEIEAMDDSDDDVQILNSDRGVRVERRKQLVNERANKSELEQVLLQRQEEAELQRALELSRKEACASAREDWEMVKRQNDQQRPSVSSAKRQEELDIREEDEDDDDILLGEQDDTSDEERKSIKSEILLDSDHEREDIVGVDIDISGANSSRGSSASVASVTFPANHLHQGDDEEVEEEEEETQLLEEDESEISDGEVEEIRRDEAGITKGGDGGDQYNTSGELFSQGDGSQEALEEEVNVDTKVESSDDDDDDDFVLALEANKFPKSSRLSRRKRKRVEEVASEPNKSLKVDDSDRDEDYQAETQIESQGVTSMDGSKEDIEKLVNGPFSLTPVESGGDEEGLKDRRKCSTTAMPLYCPPSGVPEDYSVAILQMFQCYLRQLRRCRYQSLGERGWASPIRPGPHLPKYLIHRRRGVRVPPDEDDDDDDTNPEDGVQGEEDEVMQQNQEASQRVNKYVLDESDDDFELANVSGRRKQVPDVERNNKRPRSEPRGNENVASHHHPIVCPKPIRRPPESVPRPDIKGNNSHPSQGHTVPNKGRPPTPSVRTFDFGGGGSPRLNASPRETGNESVISDSSRHGAWSSPQKLRRSSSNPEFGSLSSSGSKPTADTSMASASASPVFHNQAGESYLEKDEERAGPSKQVARVQPRNSSPWLSKASINRNGIPPSNDASQELEGGFLRGQDSFQREPLLNEEMDVPLERFQAFSAEAVVERPHPPSPQVPSPLKVIPNIPPGIECPLCGQRYPVSTIEAHASECDGSISLDDEVDINAPVAEEPKRTSLTDRCLPSTTTSHENDRTENDQRLDHLDAAILQMVENKEINLVASKKPRPKMSRSLRDGALEEDGGYTLIPRKRRGIKEAREEERMEKCFLCQKLIPKDEYLSHVKQHEVKQAGRKRTASSEEPSEEDLAMPGKMGTSRMEERTYAGNQCVNGSGDTQLREIYGTTSNLEEYEEDEDGSSDREDSLDWTRPGIPAEESDSPIKSYQSIRESRSIIDFKNQFKESSGVKSRVKTARGRGRGRARGRGKYRKGRGRGGRRGKKTSYL